VEHPRAEDLRFLEAFPLRVLFEKQGPKSLSAGELPPSPVLGLVRFEANDARNLLVRG
jgi:hypothetical protein